MKTLLSITPSRMRSINQTAVMEYIRIHKGASRAVIANELNLSLPSVVRIIDDLIEKRFVKFSGDFEHSGGRKRPLVEFDAENNISIGLEVGDGMIRGYVIDLAANTLQAEHCTFPANDPDQALSAVFKVIESLYTFVTASSRVFRGISIAVPGVTDHRTGEVAVIPGLGWENLPLQAMIEARFPVPVAVENDSNAAALGEMWFGRGDGIYNLALIHLRKGLGVGFIVDGAIYRGPNNAAGELGHIVLSSNDFASVHQDYGPVEQAIAGVGLEQQAKNKLRHMLSPAALNAISFQDLFEDYFAQEKWSVEIVRNFVETLAKVIIIISTVMDTEKIVLAGEIMGPAEPLIDSIRQKIYQNIVIEKSKIDSMASILGGAVALIQRQMDYSILKSVN